MAITDKADLFGEGIVYEECTLPSGKTVLLRSLSPQHAREIELRAIADGHEEDQHYYAALGLVYSIVHPETKERLFTDDDALPLVRNIGTEELLCLTQTINALNPQEEMEEPDPVKKPSNGLVAATDPTGTPASALPSAIDAPQAT